MMHLHTPFDVCPYQQGQCCSQCVVVSSALRHYQLMGRQTDDKMVHWLCPPSRPWLLHRPTGEVGEAGPYVAAPDARALAPLGTYTEGLVGHSQQPVRYNTRTIQCSI